MVKRLLQAEAFRRFVTRDLAAAALAVHQWKVTAAVAAEVNAFLTWRDLCRLAIVWAVLALGLPLLVLDTVHRLKRSMAWWLATGQPQDRGP